MVVPVWPQPLDPDFPLAVLEYAPSEGDRMHWHDHLEIAMVLEGHGVFRVGRRELDAGPGDVFFIDNSQPHVAGAREAGTALNLLLVLFRPELIAGPGCRDLDRGYLAPFRSDERIASSRVPAGCPLASALAPVLHELLATWGRQNPSDRHLLDATLRRVLGLAICDRGGVPRHPGTESTADRREQIRPVLAYVQRHSRERITLDDVAQVVHVSPSRLRHVFKDVTGVGFKEYLTNVRLAEAKRLLLSTDRSVAEIARAVSYTNLHQFYRVFHRAFAMTPAEYRRHYTLGGGGAGETRLAASPETSSAQRAPALG